jgi:hypothetical protein
MSVSEGEGGETTAGSKLSARGREMRQVRARLGWADARPVREKGR